MGNVLLEITKYKVSIKYWIFDVYTMMIDQILKLVLHSTSPVCTRNIE